MGRELGDDFRRAGNKLRDILIRDFDREIALAEVFADRNDLSKRHTIHLLLYLRRYLSICPYNQVFHLGPHQLCHQPQDIDPDHQVLHHYLNRVVPPPPWLYSAKVIIGAPVLGSTTQASHSLVAIIGGSFVASLAFSSRQVCNIGSG